MKVMKVSGAVKGKPVESALAILKFMPQKAAKKLEKLIRSAVANADQKPDVDVDRLVELAAAPDRAGFAESRRILLREDRVSVIVFMSASSTDLDRKRLVGKYGVIVEKAANGLMRARVPVDALIDFSGEAAVSFVDLPDRPGI